MYLANLAGRFARSVNHWRTKGVPKSPEAAELVVYESVHRVENDRAHRTLGKLLRIGGGLGCQFHQDREQKCLSLARTCARGGQYASSCWIRYNLECVGPMRVGRIKY